MIEHISIYPVEGKLKDGESVLLGKIHEIIAWINDHDKRLAPIQFLECQPGGWISVKDRLPEDNSDVLICTFESKVEIGQYDAPMWLIWNGDVWGRVTITHWMPLPAAPEDK